MAEDISPKILYLKIFVIAIVSWISPKITYSHSILNVSGNIARAGNNLKINNHAADP